MKRTLSILLTALLLMTMLPLSVDAAEDSSDREELLALACEIFPEYSNKILGNTRSTYSLPRANESRELVREETRNVSENEYLLYSEYSDGLVLLTDYTFNKEVTYDEYSTGASATSVCMDVKATCGESDYNGIFYLNDVRFTLISSAYDRIDSAGTTSTSGSCKISEVRTPRFSYSETASSKAFIEYPLDFWPGDSGYYTINSLLTIVVGNNGHSVTHVDIG